MRTTWTFGSAGQLIFGRNAVGQVGELAKSLGATRALVVTDQILSRIGVVDQVRKPLVDAGISIEVFDGGQAEPALSLVDDCLTVARPFRPDAVIGIGGGSNMDVAKLTAVLLAHPGSTRDYLGDGRVPGPTVPVIAVPTTAGTGSEVTCAAAFTDTDISVKVGMLSPYLRPRFAVVDPLLTVTCPPKVTADSGIDALTHAIEAYTAVDNQVFPLPPGETSSYQGRNPIGDMMAERAIRLIGKYLRRAVDSGKDLEARDGMALGGTLAGLAFSNVGVALVHALEDPIGGAVPVSHGAGNGLLLPYVMRFNMPVRRHEFVHIAHWLGTDVSSLYEDEAAEEAIGIIEQLRKDIGIPNRLREIGVREGQLRGFAEKAFAIKRITRVNPRPATVDDLESILVSAW
jgi:alcohol dehydrogenase class IV